MTNCQTRRIMNIRYYTDEKLDARDKEFAEI